MNLQKLSLAIFLGLSTSVAQAQFAQEGFDDYGAFQSDPVDLDQEYQDTFGRFFQINLNLGSSVVTGGLGRAYSSGFQFGLRFIFYFDRAIAAELGGGYIRHSFLYNEENTGQVAVEIDGNVSLIPFSLGVRYAFDPESLSRGFAAMNPYLVGGGELIFRSEKVKRASTFGLDSSVREKYKDSAVINSRALGVFAGGGIEFDVYRKKLYLGLDLRYHLLYWSDASNFVGTTSRRGNQISILGSASYNY